LFELIHTGNVSDARSIRSVYRKLWVKCSTLEVIDACSVLEEFGWLRLEAVETGRRSTKAPPQSLSESYLEFGDAQSSEVPKVTEGCPRGFWHFWHLVILGFSEIRTTRPTQEVWLFPG
jgi:hypothetical protein